MEQLRPTIIHTLGDYYETEYLREDCHNAKAGNQVTMNDAAVRLAKSLPKDCILVPIPSLSGNNESFARMLSFYSRKPISYCLQRGRGYGSLYQMKKDGCKVTEEDTGIWCNGGAPNGLIVLVDNVIATGTTMSAAIRAIGKPCEAVCIAVDFNTYKTYGK